MRECKVFYGTVVNDGDGWVQAGTHEMEPIRVEGQAPLGKPPEFCCADLKQQIDQHFRVYFSGGPRVVPIKIGYLVIDVGSDHIHATYCPFCGAKIVLKRI